MRIPGSYEEAPMGIRLGTPALTTRGMGLEQAEQAAHWVADVLDEPGSEAVIGRVRAAVEALCREYPVYT
jgi:glycine hydroxymethyltransferase